MAIGRRLSVTATQGSFLAGVAGGVVRSGAAVAMTPGGIVECGATSNAQAFMGFAATNIALGNPAFVISMRGSLITPLIEGGGAYTTGASVFLAATLGETTHTPPPAGVGTMVVQVGVASSASKIILNADARVGRPS